MSPLQLLAISTAALLRGGHAFNTDAEALIQQQFDEFSATRQGHGIQMVVGNIYGDSKIFSAGKQNAAGVDVSADTVFRLASMTKIMGGAVAAIAFEEGVVKPSDPVSRWIPEFAAANMRAVTLDSPNNLSSWSVQPLEREITLWDCLGMQAGFGYGFFAFGAYFPTLVAMAPNNVSLLPVAAAHCGHNQPIGQWTDHFVDCLRDHPLMNQPGAHSIYGYDYDVMGIALGRAYNMTPAALMQTKIFDPLGMTSAFIGALAPGDARSDRVMEIHALGLPPYASIIPGQADFPGNMAGLETDGEYHWASNVPSATWDWVNANGWFENISPFSPEADSFGYGSDSKMTLADYSKFLAMVSNKGVGLNGVRVMGPTTWQYFMTGTVGQSCFTPDGQSCEASGGMIVGAGQAPQYGDAPISCICQPEGNTWMWNFPENRDGEWKWGYITDRGLYASTSTGDSTYKGVPSTSPNSGKWGGYFGTTFYFDADAGVYAVGGENTFGEIGGNPQAGNDLIRYNYRVWTQMLMSADSVPGDLGAASRSGSGGDDSSDGFMALVLASVALALVLVHICVSVAIKCRAQPKNRNEDSFGM